MKKFFFLFVLILTSFVFYSQKQPYIPSFLLDHNDINGAQFSWDKTYESDNFIVIWGNSVGNDPINSIEPNLSFNPSQVTAFLESIYISYKNLGFLIDEPNSLKLAQYKFPVLMNDTWGNEPDAISGWAYAFSDGYFSIMALHPHSVNGPETLAHEFTHALQFMIDLDDLAINNPNNEAFNENAGIFFETHAEFMTSQIYPYISEIWGMDSYPMLMYGDWKNTYRNYHLLYHIHLKHGLDKVNELWFQQYDNEFPIAVYKRILNFTQSQLNDDLFEYVRRMPTLDYGIWTNYLQSNRVNNTINYDFLSIQSRYTILEREATNESHYRVPIEQAPEEYGYNIIPLYVNSSVDCVKFKFKGITSIHASAGWRYGIVAQDEQGQLHSYGEMHNENEKEFSFQIQPGIDKIYLVVMGAPIDQIQQDDIHNTWTGYPKHFRYPYEIVIDGAIPEGFQEKQSFRTFLKQNSGNYHSNGGGWVDASATVGDEVFVASHAHVLGNSQILGTNTKIEGTSIVIDAVLQNNIHVKGNAVIKGGSYNSVSNSLVEIKGNAFSENNTITGNAKIIERANVSNYNLSGNITVGGDVVVYANASCDNGIYKTLTNYYTNNPLACDNRTESHPSNLDVNGIYSNYSSAQMAFNPAFTCATLSNFNNLQIKNKPYIYPNPTIDIVSIIGLSDVEFSLKIYNNLGQLVFEKEKNRTKTISLKYLPEGIYNLVCIAADNSVTNFKVLKK